MPFLQVVTLRELTDLGDLDPTKDVVAGVLCATDGRRLTNEEITDIQDGDTVLYVRERWRLRPGDIVRVDLDGDTVPSGLYVPTNTILEQSDRTYVFVVESSGETDQVRQVEVNIFEDVGTLRRIEAVGDVMLEAGHKDRVQGRAVPDRRPESHRRRRDGGALMSLSAAAIKYRPIVLTLVVLLMVWGVISILTMPRREDPEYTVRTCVVSTVWPGAPAEKVEELVTKPLEEVIDRIDEVDIVRSTTNIGLSTIYVDAEDSVSPEQIDKRVGQSASPSQASLYAGTGDGAGRERRVRRHLHHSVGGLPDASAG